MPTYPGVIIRVKSVRGTCPVGHQVGDTFKMIEKTPEGICNTAYPAILSAARVLQYGGRFPWRPASEDAVAACPDPVNTVVFEIIVDHTAKRVVAGGETGEPG